MDLTEEQLEAMAAYQALAYGPMPEPTAEDIAYAEDWADYEADRLASASNAVR